MWWEQIFISFGSRCSPSAAHTRMRLRSATSLLLRYKGIVAEMAQRPSARKACGRRSGVPPMMRREWGHSRSAAKAACAGWSSTTRPRLAPPKRRRSFCLETAKECSAKPLVCTLHHGDLPTAATSRQGMPERALTITVQVRQDHGSRPVVARLWPPGGNPLA